MWYHLLPFLLLVVSSVAGPPPTTRATQRPIKIQNDSGSRAEIHWINPDTKELVLMTDPDILNGAVFSLNSYIGHEFEIRELPSTKTGGCKGSEQTCRSNYLAVTENSEQLATLNRDFEIVFEDDQIRAKREAAAIVAGCHEDAKQRLVEAKGDQALSITIMEDLVGCVQSGVENRITKANEEIAFQAKVRTEMAEQMENYTCADLSLDSSPSLENTTWVSAKDKTTRKVKIMLNRNASKIHVIENFIGEDECNAMEAAAKKLLHRATVADGKGGTQLSEHRKAMQAGIKVPWNQESRGNLIARLSRRVYEYTENVLKLGIDEFGQEDLMSIQYFGRGINDTEPDRYTPHCDGDCKGLRHKTGTRVATMVLYCTVPESGGHTNFRNSGVHVKPVKGNGIFFSYVDPETLIMDNGFTEHSGCPVFEGEKKIVTQWIRLGVDAKNTWDTFNTLGIKYSDAE